MTVHEAKNYLLRIRDYLAVATALEEQIEVLRTQAEGVRAILYDKDRVQTSPRNRLEEVMPKLIELEVRYQEAIIECRVELARRVSLIDSIEDPLRAKVLRMRYCEDATWTEIATASGKSTRHVQREHGEALREFSDILKKRLACHT